MSAEFEKKHYRGGEWAHFSALVTVKGPGTLLYLSGIGAENDADGSVCHPGDAYAQSCLAFKKAKDLLAQHGASLKDIVKITAYLTDVRDRPHYQKARKEALEGITDLPSHTLIVVTSLARHGMLMEINIDAAIAA